MGGEEYLVLGNKCLKFVEELNKKKDLSLVFQKIYFFRRFINSDSFFIIEPADRCNSHWLFDLEKKRRYNPVFAKLKQFFSRKGILQ